MWWDRSMHGTENGAVLGVSVGAELGVVVDAALGDPLGLVANT